MIKDQNQTEKDVPQVQIQQFSNRMVNRCLKERSAYIKKQLQNIMRKQLRCFFATEKIEREIQSKGKDLVFTATKSPIERVQNFRLLQRQKQNEKFRAFKQKQAERVKKIAQKIKQRSQSQALKSNQNIIRRSQAHRKIESHIQQQNQRIEELKQNLTISTERPNRKMCISSLIEHEPNQDHDRYRESLYQVQEKAKEKQQGIVNAYLVKIIAAEERILRNQIKLELRKSQSAKKLPRYSLAMRVKEEEQLVKKWTNQYQTKMEGFKNTFRMKTQSRIKAAHDRSIQRNQTQNEILARKHQQDFAIVTLRAQKLQKKLKKIHRLSHRSSNLSQQSFKHNKLKKQQNMQKEEHSTIMQKIYNVIDKLKKLDNNQKLKRNQVQLLMRNLDHQNQEFGEFIKFLNLTKEKYFQIKRKESEDRIKKMKKSCKKMI